MITPVFIITQLVATLCGIVYTGWHLYLIPHGIALGFGETQSSFLASFGGLGIVIGRLSHGTFVDRGVIQATDLFAGASVVLAVACVLDQLASSSFIAITTLAVIAGLALGIAYPLLYVMAVDVPQGRHVFCFSLVVFIPRHWDDIRQFFCVVKYTLKNILLYRTNNLKLLEIHCTFVCLFDFLILFDFYDFTSTPCWGTIYCTKRSGHKLGMARVVDTRCEHTACRD